VPAVRYPGREKSSFHQHCRDERYRVDAVLPADLGGALRANRKITKVRLSLLSSTPQEDGGSENIQRAVAIVFQTRGRFSSAILLFPMKASAAIRAVGASTVALALALAASFGPGQLVTRFPAELDEISGIGQSRSSPNVFWVHNDSGDQPRVYAVNRNGALLGTYLLEGAAAVDWEDMAIGPGPGGRSYLYLADIGDNSARRMSIRVYRVLEPRVEANQTPVTTTLSGVTAFDFVYEDGPRDAEGFMVDPLSGEFYIVSKRELAGNRLYRSEAPVAGQVNTLMRAGTFPFTGTTGAAISPDGLQVVIRRYSTATNSFTPPASAASYWSRPNASIALVDLLKQSGQIIPLTPEVQGEAITFSADNRGFYTTTERGSGASAPLAPLTFYAPVPEAPPAKQ